MSTGQSEIAIKIGSVVPWRVMEFLGRRAPKAYQLLAYGTTNINTREHWSEAWSKHGVGGYRATGEIAEVRDLILRAVPPKSKILDVGCGVGEIMSLLRDSLGCDCTGLDIAPPGVEAVIKKGMKAKVSELPEIPFPDRSFDVVVSTETLEHVSDAGATLASIARVLAPKGLLVVSVPDGAVDDESTHVHRFTKAKLERMLERHFSIESVQAISLKESCPCLFAVARNR